MQDTFTIAQDLSFGEYFRISLNQLSKAKLIRRLFIFVTCIGLLAGLSGLLAPGNNESIGIGSLMQIFLVPLSFLLFFFVFLFLYSIFIVRFKPYIIRGITYRFTHWGMERIGTRTEATIPWRDFQKLIETRSFFFLYARENNLNNIHIIQKRMFADFEEAGKFKAFLERNLPL